MKSKRLATLKSVAEPSEDTLVSDAIMQQVIEAVYRSAKVVRSYHVPYLAGSSHKGTIYIDRRLPRTLRTGRRRVAVDPFITLHEAVERVVGDALQLRYQHAHQIALRVEEAAVRAAGISWRDYNDLMDKYQDIARRSFSRLPPDLDLKPYRHEHDSGTLRRIRKVKRRAKPSRL